MNAAIKHGFIIGTMVGLLVGLILWWMTGVYTCLFFIPFTSIMGAAPQILNSKDPSNK